MSSIVPDQQYNMINCITIRIETSYQATSPRIHKIAISWINSYIYRPITQ